MRNGTPFPPESRHHDRRFDAFKRTLNRANSRGHVFGRSIDRYVPIHSRCCLKCDGRSYLFENQDGWFEFHEPPLLLMQRCPGEQT